MADAVQSGVDDSRQCGSAEIAGQEPRIRHTENQDAICDRFREERGVRRASTHATRMCASRHFSTNASAPFISTCPANRCSSAACAIAPTRHRCAKTSPPAFSSCPAGCRYATARPDVRQRHHPARSSANGAEHRPGLGRSFALQKLNNFNRKAWEQLLADSQAQRATAPTLADLG